MKRKWMGGERSLWFVFGANDSIWLSTAAFKRRNAIKYWNEQQPDGGYPWRYWYNRGFRVRRAKVQYANT